MLGIGIAELVIIVLVVALFGIGVYWHFWAEGRRSQALAETAEVLGMQYQKDDGRVVGAFMELPLLQRGQGTKRIYNVLWADTDEERLAVFDFDFTIGSGKNRQTFRQTVVGFHSSRLALPRIRISRQRWYHALGKTVGMQDIDWREYPEFSRTFLVQGDEAGIRQWMSPAFMQTMMEHPDYTIEGAGDRMLIYKLRVRVRPANLREYLKEAYVLIDAAREATQRRDQA